MVRELYFSISCVRGGFVIILALVALFILTSVRVLAQDDFFLPNTLTRGDNYQHTSFSSLNNVQLSVQAEAILSPALNTDQRAPSHQWLKSHQDDDFAHGSKTFKVFFKRGLREYWDRQCVEHFSNQYVPSIDGRGAVSSGVDYGL